MHGVKFQLALGTMLSLVLLLVGCGNSPQIAVGSSAPDFSLADARGDMVALSDFSGQPVLLFFHMALG